MQDTQRAFERGNESSDESIEDEGIDEGGRESQQRRSEGEAFRDDDGPTQRNGPSNHEDSSTSLSSSGSNEPDDEDNDQDATAEDDGGVFMEDERTAVKPTFFMDDVHAQAVSELRDADIDVDVALSQRLYRTTEQAVYDLRQEVKYDNGGRQ